MAASDLADRFVTLKGGMIVPAAAYVLLLNLEARAFRLHREGKHTLIVRPPERLTADDIASIVRWKWHLLMLVDYCQRGNDVDAHLFTDTPREVHHA